MIGTGIKPLTELDRERSKAVAQSTWSWPEAQADPIPDSAIYQYRHPIRYVWRPNIEVWSRWLVDTFPWAAWCNTYYEHPEGWGFEVASTDPDGTVWYNENTSFDVWGPQGRNDPIGTTVGQQIFDILFNDPNPPNINWIIWQRWMWTRAGGWSPFGTDPFSWHEDHIHVTYL